MKASDMWHSVMSILKHSNERVSAPPMALSPNITPSMEPSPIAHTSSYYPAMYLSLAPGIFIFPSFLS
jgi:hypothetical protein